MVLRVHPYTIAFFAFVIGFQLGGLVIGLAFETGLVTPRHESVTEAQTAAKNPDGVSDGKSEKASE